MGRIKLIHGDVYNYVQKYVNENAKRASNQELRNIAADVESSTLSLFNKLNEIKVINCESLN